MYFVGVDLAWGGRNPSGIAVLDDAGTLVRLCAAREDAEIVAAIEPYAGDCLLAVDAPLVVTNPTGNRPCEAALNRDFRAFDAGTHPANTGRPWFADGTRAARLAAALRSPAIEVYPHAATVALFGLPRTLKYKHKPGRDMASCQDELCRLMDLVETLPVELGEQWRALRRAVTAATRKAELRRAEDPVDAVVCAYVGLYATRRPDDVTVYGDPATGCIVTPSLSPGRRPGASGR